MSETRTLRVKEKQQSRVINKNGQNNTFSSDIQLFQYYLLLQKLRLLC